MSKSSKRIILPQYIFEDWRNPVFFFHKRKLQLLVKFKFHDLRQSDSDKRCSHEASSEMVGTQHIFYHRWHLRTLRLQKQGRIIVESCCRDGHPYDAPQKAFCKNAQPASTRCESRVWDFPTSILQRKNGLCIYEDTACYNGVGSEKLTASELLRCPNLSYNEDVLRERSIA